MSIRFDSPTTVENQWSRDMNLRLISELKKRRSLWDLNSLEFKDKYQKKIDYQELSAIFLMPCSEVEKRIHNLKRQFHREYRKTKIDKITPYKSQWYGFSPLKFLIENKKERIPKPFPKAEFCNFQKIHLEPAVTLSAKSPSSMENLSQSLEEQLDNKDLFQNSKEIFYTTRKKENQEDIKSRDEFTVFGEYVTFELRKITNPYVMAIAKHKIQESLFQAQMDMFSAMCDFNETGDSYIQYYSENNTHVAMSNSSSVDHKMNK